MDMPIAASTAVAFNKKKQYTKPTGVCSTAETAANPKIELTSRSSVQKRASKTLVVLNTRFSKAIEQAIKASSTENPTWDGSTSKANKLSQHSSNCHEEELNMI